VTEIEIWRTPTGLPNGGGGFFLRTRDAAKFGQLLLNDGTWNGERIISSEWLAESVTPRTAIGWPDPSAWGYGGQWVIVLPSLDVVVAINSNGYGGGDAALNQAHALVAHHILPALR
jgi:CubicO group peptidase (beta-lactamase class C family)